MNTVQLVGRLTADPEVRYSTGENSTAILRFTVAVNRTFKNKDGNYDADFISCQAFGKTAEFINQYFKKGQMIGVVGNIRKGSYEKDGQKVYTTDVYVNNVEFVGSKNDNGETTNTTRTTTPNPHNNLDMSFMNIPPAEDESPLPFM